MAIGDLIALQLGTAETDHQPASGVEERISIIMKDQTTAGNTLNIYDGSDTYAIANANVRLDVADANSSAMMIQKAYNMGIMINNSIYIRKTGTARVYYIGGVTTNV